LTVSVGFARESLTMSNWPVAAPVVVGSKTTLNVTV
jgi:hypothetical protein